MSWCIDKARRILNKEPYYGPTVRPRGDHLSSQELKDLYSRYVTDTSQPVVSTCAAAMYSHPTSETNNWTYRMAGVPVLVWQPNDGGVLIYIAEIGTCNLLFSMKIGNAGQISRFKRKTARFYTIVSSTGDERIGLRFDCRKVADAVMSSLLSTLVSYSEEWRKKMLERPLPRRRPRADPSAPAELQLQWRPPRNAPRHLSATK